MAQTDEAGVVSDPEPKGIGGWLILPLIGLIFAPLYLLWLVWQRLPEIAEKVPAHALVAQIATIILTLPFFAFLIFCLVRFLQERRSVPWLMTIFYGFNVIAGLAVIIGRLKGYDFPEELAAYSLVAGHTLTTAIQTLLSIVWIFYFHNSVRVANTFTVVGRSREQKREPKGLGGWLIVPLAIVAALLVFMVIDAVMTRLGPRMLFAYGHSHWLVLCRLTFFAALGIGGSAISLFYALRQKRVARWLLLGYFTIWTVVVAVTLVVEPFKTVGAIFGVLFLAFTAYLLLSRRVKNTFVR